MLVRFEPRDKGQYSTLVEGDSQKFWDMIEERCGRDVADYLNDKINELEETISEAPCQTKFDDMHEYLTAIVRIMTKGETHESTEY